jgi:hypothetical protein
MEYSLLEKIERSKNHPSIFVPLLFFGAIVSSFDGVLF